MAIVAVPTFADLTGEQADALLRHPAQIATMQVVARLINDLRSCATAADYDTFQRELFRHYFEVETHRADVRRILKRLRQGRTVDQRAPELRNGLPAADTESWHLEDLTYGRLVRQLRAVGDALAWRACGFNRSFVTALARNAPPGPMVNKEGLGWELGAVNEIFRERGQFVLLHDLTNCLRIGDATEFTADRGAQLHEVKKSGRTNRTQMNRMQAAVDAVMHGSELPGGQNARLFRLESRLVTHQRSLADATTLAHQRGVVGMIIPGGGRGLRCADLLTLGQQHTSDGVERWEREQIRLRHRLGVRAETYELVSHSAERAARNPELAPYGIYPLGPNDCAQLICDYMIFDVRMGAEQLISSAHRAGLHCELLLPSRSQDLTGDAAVAQLRRGSTGLTLHGNAVDRLLLEMVDLTSFMAGIAEMMTATPHAVHPVPIFANEDALWT